MPLRRRLPAPPAPPARIDDALAEALADASAAIQHVLGAWTGWDELARSLRRTEEQLRQDVVVAVVLADGIARGAPGIVAAGRAQAIRTAQQLDGYLASARAAGLAPPRAVRIAAFALGELIGALRAPRRPAGEARN